MVYSTMSDDQDWEVVKIKGSRPSRPTTSSMVNQGSSAPKVSVSNKSAELRKVAETDVGKPKMLTNESRAAMAAGRAALKLTQKQLDMRCSFPTNSCNSWESGRATQCPNSIQIQMLQRVLGVKLERT